MKKRFIQYIPSEKASWLRRNYPNAFLLLSLVAEQARRSNDILDGLLPGDAIMGNYEDAGLTHKQYRNARDKLIELSYIEVVWNPKIKNLQKRAIKRAIKSEVFNLLNSEIWDINSVEDGNQKGNLGAINGQSMGNKQEGIRMNNKEEQQQTSVAVFSCLLNLDISDYEKQWISKNYDEQIVIDAVSSVTHSSFVVKESFIQALKHACKHNFKPKKAKEDIAKENKESVIKMDGMMNKPKNCVISFLNKAVEFTPQGGNVPPEAIEYDNPQFKEKFEKNLFKWEFVS